MIDEKVYPTYFGGKNGSGVYQNIINCIRPHDVYMEPFLGNGAVFRYKRPADISVLNDADLEVCERWATAGIDVLNCDAVELLQKYDFNTGLKYCLYLDPPYPLQSRRSSKDVYNYEMTDQQHEQLLRVITSLPGYIDILISTYKNDLYADYLSGWNLKTFRAKTRQGVATEYLYMNYSNPEGLLHDYRYLGNDFTDRPA